MLGRTAGGVGDWLDVEHGERWRWKTMSLVCELGHPENIIPFTEAENPGEQWVAEYVGQGSSLRGWLSFQMKTV
jgi:hypothetical protein